MTKLPKQRKKPDKPPGKPDGPPGQQPPQSGMDSLTAQSLTVGSPYCTVPDFQIDESVPPEIPPDTGIVALIASPLDCGPATLKLSAFAISGGPADVDAAALVTAPPYHSTPDFGATRSRTWFGSYRQ